MTGDELKQLSDDIIKQLRAGFGAIFASDAADALEAQQTLIARLISQRDTQEVLIGEHIAAQREAEGRAEKWHGAPLGVGGY